MTPQNNNNQWVKLEHSQTIVPPIMVSSPNLLNNNQYICPIVFNPNIFYMMPQTFM